MVPDCVLFESDLADSRPCPLSSLLSEQQLASARHLLPDVQAGTDFVGSDGDCSAFQVVPTRDAPILEQDGSYDIRGACTVEQD